MRRRGDDGFALMDVLVATLIASIALATTLGGIALAGRTMRAVDSRVHAFIEVENEEAQGRRLVFQPAHPAE
jgi:type II secretory pathway component PulJ